MKKFKDMTKQEERDYFNSFRGALRCTIEYWITILWISFLLIFIFTSIHSLVTLSLQPYINAFHMFNPIEHLWMRITLLCLFVPSWLIYRIIQNYVNFFPVVDENGKVLWRDGKDHWDSDKNIEKFTDYNDENIENKND